MNFGWFAFDRGGTPAKRDGDNRERERLLTQRTVVFFVD